MPDIVMLTKADRPISEATLVSLVKYAQENRVILSTNSGVNWMGGEKLIDYRLAAIKKAAADGVYFLDDDDELLRPLPSTEQLAGYDYVLAPLIDKGKVRSLSTCSSRRLFGFHMTLARREIAIAALEYAHSRRFWSEDTAYCIWIIENCKGAKLTEALVQKNGDRIPYEVAGFREGAKLENHEVWRDRLFKIRQNVLPQLPIASLGG